MVVPLKILNEQGIEVDSLDFGITPYDQAITTTFWVSNPNIIDFFDVIIRTNSPSLTVTKQPFKVSAGGRTPFTIEWSGQSSLTKERAQLTLTARYVE